MLIKLLQNSAGGEILIQFNNNVISYSEEIFIFSPFMLQKAQKNFFKFKLILLGLGNIQKLGYNYGY